MHEYLSYGFQFVIGFMLQYSILQRNWLLAVVSVLLLLAGTVYRVDTYIDVISFFVGVIAATYYQHNYV